MPERLTPEMRSIRARAAAHTRWAQENPAAHTAKMREAFNERFHNEVDPERVLPKDERLRRAQHAKKAYMAKLALASAKARTAKGAES